jgi:hypothetical protein
MCILEQERTENDLRKWKVRSDRCQRRITDKTCRFLIGLKLEDMLLGRRCVIDWNITKVTPIFWHEFAKIERYLFVAHDKQVKWSKTQPHHAAKLLWAWG